MIYVFFTDRECQGGGLAMFQRLYFSCVIIDLSTNHIDVEVEETNVGRWRLMGYYDYFESRHRRDGWNMLCNLGQVSNLPWCIIADFNDILSSKEKKGRVGQVQWLINGSDKQCLTLSLLMCIWMVALLHCLRVWELNEPWRNDQIMLWLIICGIKSSSMQILKI